MPLIRVWIVTLDGRDCDLRAVEVYLLRLVAAYNIKPTVGRCNCRIKSAHAHGSNGAPFVLKHHNKFVDQENYIKLYCFVNIYYH